jgi:DNA-binding CsgD family transcriptional regulator
MSMSSDASSGLGPTWRLPLPPGARARLRGSIDFDHGSVPVDVSARVDVDDPSLVSIELVLPATPPDGDGARLTPRERKVVSLIAKGYETDEIAHQLFITSATVRTHVRNAMSRFGARTRAQLVAAVMSAGASVASDDSPDSPS